MKIYLDKGLYSIWLSLATLIIFGNNEKADI